MKPSFCSEFTSKTSQLGHLATSTGHNTDNSVYVLIVLVLTAAMVLSSGAVVPVPKWSCSCANADGLPGIYSAGLGRCQTCVQRFPPLTLPRG